jgi:hypothetical protein
LVPAAAAAEVVRNSTCAPWLVNGVMDILPGCQVLPVLDLIGVADGTK